MTTAHRNTVLPALPRMLFDRNNHYLKTAAFICTLVPLSHLYYLSAFYSLKVIEDAEENKALYLLTHTI